MTAAGLIFSNIHDFSLPELTARRTMASVPYGCRYRLIDFPLSNMVNSGISKIGIIAHNNYQSLLDHIGTGKDWDLARRSGGIKILPPFISAYESSTAKHVYSTRLEALIGVRAFISKCSEDYIVLSDCDSICNVDISDVIAAHERNGADMTIVTREQRVGEKISDSEASMICCDENGKITDVLFFDPDRKDAQISTNIIVVDRIYLLGLLDHAASRGYSDFYRDVVGTAIKRGGVYAYRFDGIIMSITSLESYFDASMKLLDESVREGLIGVGERAIYTKVRNSAPTIYKEGCVVKNSCIADGCEIEGQVENSIIFRGVKIGKGSVVKNSVILQGGYIGDDVHLNCVVSDKDVVVKDGRELSGYITMPFFISKGTVV